MTKHTFLLSFFLCISWFELDAQYILNGSATKDNCNCYTLTQAVNTQSGSVWNSNKINLSQPFDFWFNVFLGCKDADGADGIVFMLQPISTSLGASGGGLGFQGVVPSIGVVLDTWQNTSDNDPVYDHISINANGVIAHGADLAGPVQASATSQNIEDCQWHVVRISWDPVTKFIRAYFDDSLRVEANTDLVANIFNNDPMVYWGFSAATGGSNNLQQFCTALNPVFSTSLGMNNTSCGLQPVQFQNTSQSFGPIQSFYWDFGDGSTSNQQNPPPKMYAQEGIYEVKLVITGLDGCTSDTLRKTITIGSKPIADFTVMDTCATKPPSITDLSSNTVGNITEWSWFLDGSLVSGSQQPQFFGLPAGSHELKLAVKSVYGCTSDTIVKTVTLKSLPQISVTTDDGCENKELFFSAAQTDMSTNITQWQWNFGDGNTAMIKDPVHTYGLTGNYNITTWAVADNGCSSDTVANLVSINKAKAFAGNDTIILKDVPFQLQGTGGGSYAWSPATGLNNAFIPNPVAILQDDMTYELTIETPEGCVAKDSIHLTVFKGSAIYVPTGFTPNDDGLNDLLKPMYIGIRQLEYFIIYNRWGQKVFETKDLSAGWNGRLNGQVQSTASFVWMLKAVDYVGKKYEMKGSFILIK
ncbi:MAG: T9SS type B sorting domain-containing protein [Terrimonas sp.]|nr:T9SS type B sorting domain-containing protein [Terrimonas sp.]